MGEEKEVKAYTIDQCMNRLRNVRQLAEQTQSTEPIRALFRNLGQYGKRYNPNPIALANWARMHSLFEAHFSEWYRQFQKEHPDTLVPLSKETIQSLRW